MKTQTISAMRAAADKAWDAHKAVQARAAAKGPAFLKDKALMAELESTSKAYDVAAEDLRQAELASLASKLESDPPAAGEAYDGAGLVRRISEWTRALGTQLAGDPNARVGSSPSFKFIPKRDVRAALMSTTSYPTVPTRRPGVVPLPAAPLTLLDVLPIVPVDNDVVEIIREKTFTNTAAETAEGDAAPEGTLEFEKTTVSAKWLPFTIPATKQVLSDEGRLASFVDERLMRGVRERLQRQVINGDGLGDNLLGLTQTPGILTQDAGADIAPDIIHHAKTKVIVQTKGLWTPQTLMLHPLDYERIVLDKDGNNNYRYGGPQVDGAGFVWGLLPVVNVEVTEGSPIVCDITAAELYVRDDVSVAVSDSHGTQFTQGIVQFLASGRWGLGVLEPKAFVVCENFDS